MAGPPGPAGAPGPTGPAGPQGPAGAATGVFDYAVLSVLGGPGETTGTVTCPEGRVAISGGARAPSGASGQLLESYPSSATSWTSTVTGVSITQQAVFHAVCVQGTAPPTGPPPTAGARPAPATAAGPAAGPDPLWSLMTALQRLLP